ncbi:MAG: GNAT family N-acetyltransferase, partial [Chloroflexota bacterium]|nr:GNAT family N-acetyltransferase [Chloroflexota bacterium]
ARIVSAAYVEECLRRGLVATWDCDQVNVASGALALDLGFGDERSFTELAPPRRASHAFTSAVGGDHARVWRGRGVAA